MVTHPAAAEWLIRLTLLACCMELGGTLYEHLVLDAVWPARPSLIQPGAGGVDRKTFWMPLHGLLTLAFPAALWASWGSPAARWWLVGGLGLYVVMRVWTFAYFIPAALRFETADVVSLDDARAWVRWSIGRAPLLVATTWAVWRASRALGGGAP